MSLEALTNVWKHSKQKGGELLVLLAMADYANEDMDCWPSVKKLAEKSRMKPRNVQYCLRKLEAGNEIKLVSQGGISGGVKSSNRYQILIGCKPCMGAMDGKTGVQPIASNPSVDPSVPISKDQPKLIETESDKLGNKFFSEYIPFELAVLGVPFAESWKAFVLDRKEKKKPLTRRAAEMLFKKLVNHPADVVAGLTMAIEKGWRGFEWEWFYNEMQKRSKVSPAIPAQRRMPSLSEQRKARQGK